jgi:hypothetical protein
MMQSGGRRTGTDDEGQEGPEPADRSCDAARPLTIHANHGDDLSSIGGVCGFIGRCDISSLTEALPTNSDDEMTFSNFIADS